MTLRPASLASIQAGLLLLAFIASLGIGAADIPLRTLLDAATGGDTGVLLILREIRLPRALLALVIGAGLGMSGAALQALLRNPLAEPGVVGISATGALGAVLAFYSGASAHLALALPLGGLLGALAGTLVILRLTRGTGASLGLILAGVALTTLASAGTSLVLSLAPNPYAAYEIIFWLMGSLADRSLSHVLLALPLMLLGWGLLLSTAPALDALTLGEDTAASLGFDPVWLRARLIGGTALAVGSAVAMVGAIGFVGLVVPHLIRPLVGNRPGRLLLVSGFGGAILVLLADLALRLSPIRPELKLGVVTALIGAPFLFSLVNRMRREA